MKWVISSMVLAGVLSASVVVACEYSASDFATSVVEYIPGDSASSPFNDPESALGRPTVDTRGDGGSTGSPLDPVVVLPVNPAFRGEEVVTIGLGGHLILKFDRPIEDHPHNPCGIDFIIFGNVVHSVQSHPDHGPFWNNGDPYEWIIRTVADGSTGDVTWGEPGVVAVSQDGQQWFTFDNSGHDPPKPTPYADTDMPTLGRVYDPDDPEPSLPGNQWWGRPTDPTLPVNPLWTGADFDGLTVAEYAQRYGCAAGGTGFDLKDVGLPWIQYVRVSNGFEDDLTPEVDAVSIVKPYLFPDFDCDNDVDADDLAYFLSCFTGPALGPPEGDCARADFDQDGDVDQADFAILQRCLSGPDQPVDRGCMSP